MEKEEQASQLGKTEQNFGLLWLGRLTLSLHLNTQSHFPSLSSVKMLALHLPLNIVDLIIL